MWNLDDTQANIFNSTIEQKKFNNIRINCMWNDGVKINNNLKLEKKKLSAKPYLNLNRLAFEQKDYVAVMNFTIGIKKWMNLFQYTKFWWKYYKIKCYIDLLIMKPNKQWLNKKIFLYKISWNTFKMLK